MIFFILLMIGAIGVPVAVEAIRSPDDNLLHDTRVEVIESFVEPAQQKMRAIAESASAGVRRLTTSFLLGRLIMRLLKFITSLFK